MITQLLIVDDEAPIRETFAWYFRKKGYQVIALVSAAAAREYLAEHRPDLVVLDINLPDADGLDLVRPIKTRHSRLPVIIFTGLEPNQALIQRAKESGADAFLIKTQPLDSMLEKIQGLVNKP